MFIMSKTGRLKLLTYKIDRDGRYILYLFGKKYATVNENVEYWEKEYISNYTTK